MQKDGSGVITKYSYETSSRI